MRLLFAALFAVTLAGGGLSISHAEDAAGANDGKTAPADSGADAANAGAPKDQSKPESDQGSGKAADSKPKFDVHRHRPGACPEGPPCKMGD